MSPTQPALDEANDALEAVARHVRDLAAAAPGWCWEIGPDLRVTYAGDQLKMATGLSPDNIVGRPLRGLLAGAVDREAMKLYFDLLHEHRPFRDIVIPYRRGDGRKGHFRVSGVPVMADDGSFLGHRGFAADITAEAEAGALAERSEALLREAIESLAEGFALFDSNERLVLCNSRYRDMVGLVKESLVPGISMEGLLQLAAQRRQFQFESAEAWISDRLRRFRDSTSPSEERTHDRRYVRFADYPTACGGRICLRTDVTDIRLAEQRLRDAIDSLSNGFVLWDSMDRLVMCNERFRDIYRFLGKAEDLTGRQFSELMRPLIDDDLVEMENGESVQHWFAGRLNPNQAPAAQPFLLHFKDGRYIEVCEHRTTEGGRVSICSDVTDRKRTEAALTESEHKFKGFLTASPDAMIVVNEIGDIILASDRAVALFGYSREELVGKPVGMLLPERYQTGHKALMDRYFANPKARNVYTGTDLYGRCKDGTEFPAEISLGPTRTSDGLVTLVAVRDVSVRKHADAMMRRAQKMEALGTLAGGIAHDLNNMLVPILTFTKLTAESLPETGSEQGYLSVVVEAANRAKELVEQILIYSRSETTERRPIDLAWVVGEALKILRAGIPRTISLQADIASEPLPILGNRTQIHQLVMNLCSNAADAIGGKTGKIAVILRAERGIDGRASETAPYGCARLSTIDDGIGIDEATIERIFDPFFTTKPVGEGSGLGLAIVQSIVAGHGGTISVESCVGAGTRFDLLFPLLKDPIETTG